MRQIVLDIETTGISHSAGHRIVELACIELVGYKKTGLRFHHYINPEREVDFGAMKVHGLNAEFLSDKPKFTEIADSFVDFVRGAELIIHNAPFDVGFLENELKLVNRPPLTSFCSGVFDTLAMAREKHPRQKNNLDALCERYRIDNSGRDLHGALLDADLLAEVFLSMSGKRNLV